MVNYHLTNKAKLDLIDIWDYTSEVWSENQAQKYYDQLIDSFVYITQNLKAGKDYSEVKESLFGIKVGRHIVFYLIEDKKSVVIVRILHERMDIESRLSE